MYLTFITGNAKKFEEVQSVLDASVTLVNQHFDLTEPQSMDLAFISNIKARSAFGHVQSPVIVEDTGIYFHDYKEFPGPFAKFAFQQLGFDGFQKLLGPGAKGSMKTILSYMDETLDDPLQFVGEVSGTWSFDFVNDEVLSLAVPYNNIFIPDGWSMPCANDYELWKQDNQRSRAVRKFNEWVKGI